jgi:hypothetical protein
MAIWALQKSFKNHWFLTSFAPGRPKAFQSGIDVRHCRPVSRSGLLGDPSNRSSVLRFGLLLHLCDPQAALLGLPRIPETSPVASWVSRAFGPCAVDRPCMFGEHGREGLAWNHVMECSDRDERGVTKPGREAVLTASHAR